MNNLLLILILLLAAGLAVRSLLGAKKGGCSGTCGCCGGGCCGKQRTGEPHSCTCRHSRD